MIVDPMFYLAATFGVLLAGISKSGFGGASGGLAVPLMALTVAPPQAAAIMLPILLAMDAIGLVVFRGQFDRANLRIILPGAVVGIALGAGREAPLPGVEATRTYDDLTIVDVL